MAAKQPRQRRTYTVEEANASLPLVGAIVSDLVRVSRQVIERRERLSVLLTGREADSSDPYREELAQIEEELAKDTRRTQRYVEELKELGVEPGNSTEGLVDFPAFIDGRKVFLCWKLGEPEVVHWHELGAGVRNRQPLAAASGSGDRPASGSH